MVNVHLIFQILNLKFFSMLHIWIKRRIIFFLQLYFRCIVEFLLEHVEHDDTLDKSFTPPAPLMATYEQKITALLIDLEVSKPTVLHFVQVAIEYKLFNLSSEVKVYMCICLI